MIIAQSDGNTVQVIDYFSVSKDTPTQITQGTITLLSSEITSNGIIANFSRKISTGLSTDTDITVNLTIPLDFGYLTTQRGFKKHNQLGSGIITFGDTNETSSFINDNSSDDNFWQDHGIYMTVMWIGIIQLAIIVMRYFKWWSLSSLVHSSLGTIALSITLYSSYQAYNKNESTISSLNGDSNLRYHSRLAFTLSALCLSQFILGIFTKYILMYSTKVRVMMLARRVHQILGWSTPIIALINIYYGWGLQNKQSTLNNIVYPCYGLLILVVILFEARHRFGESIGRWLVKWRTHKLDSFKGQLTQSVVEGISSFLIETEGQRHIDIYNEIRINKRKWVFYDEFILDVSGFRLNHPGGSFIFNSVYGQDIGKFINGSSSINDEINPYTHSQVAKDMVNFLKIGRLAFPVGIFINRIKTEEQSSMVWALSNSTKVSSSVYCLEFSSEAWDIVENPSGFEWMGKHFLVTAKIGKKTVCRYYRLTLVNLSSWAQEVRNKGMPAKDYDTSKTPGKLRLYVKRYEDGKLSPYICDLKINEQLHFKGPLGPGLCTQAFIAEDYLIIAAGTGILPFLDFCYSIWNNLSIKQRVFCYVAFRNEEESFGIDLLEAVAAIHPKSFFLRKRTSEKDLQLDEAVLKKWIKLNYVHKVWICGPPGFNRKYHDILIRLEVPPSKILLL